MRTASWRQARRGVGTNKDEPTAETVTQVEKRQKSLGAGSQELERKNQEVNKVDGKLEQLDSRSRVQDKDATGLTSLSLVLTKLLPDSPPALETMHMVPRRAPPRMAAALLGGGLIVGGQMAAPNRGQPNKRRGRIGGAK